jgi:signal peptidase I
MSAAYGFGGLDGTGGATAVEEGPAVGTVAPVAPVASVAPVATPVTVRSRRAWLTVLRSAWAFAGSGILGIAVGVVAAFALSIPLGYRSLTVLSGSMEPAIHVGDVVMERSLPPAEVRVGDVVTFRDPDDPSTLVTHRVRSVRIHDGQVDVVTKGDANNTVERWTIPVDGRLGVVRARIPRVGFLVVWASGRTGRIALIAIPALLLGVLELIRIWRPRRAPQP